MPTDAASTRPPNAVRLYFVGLGFIMLGAALMDYFDSLVPMALCASAGLMCSAPLINQLGRRFLTRPSRQRAD